MKAEILRLQGLIKGLEQELHDCCISVLDISSLMDEVEKRNLGLFDNGQSVIICVNDALSDIYHKYDYRVRGYNAENIIMGEAEF